MLPRVLVIGFCIANAVGSHAGPLQDFLRRDLDSLPAYHHAIRHILPQGWRKDVVLRTLIIEPFSTETVIAIRRESAGYRAFAVAPTSEIWKEALAERRHPNYAKFHLKYAERPLANEVAERCIKLWYDVLSDRRNYQEENLIYLDTTQVYFFVRLASHAPLTAWTHAWEEKKARAGKLLALSEGLASYIEGTLSEAKLVAYLTRAEKTIKASN
jgi:hypothetical protein